ncbi:ORF6C domain-containing protein [Latilactobacillus sakei]|uniref:ORF6C domain-containing protein n=1 Tax=Latilactobacillus sakei TaxID=1599 RepID=UPI0020C7F925|nr:ORF6C domain-containing protein [Latilactobacillus sakei]MCP8851781.1 ORF6C domain-containing protein [Latilactobacillus sakei]
MNELIQTFQNNDGQTVVSGRDLHRFLKVGKDFSTWFKDMVAYGFTEGRDFSPISGKSSGGRPRIEYAMTIDMAKEVSMIQRTEVGKMARQYFIDMEKQAKALPMSMEDMMINQLQEQKKIKSDVNMLKDNMRITSANQFTLQSYGRKQVVSILGGKKSAAYQHFSAKAFSQLWRDFKQAFSIPRYSDLPQAKFDDGLEFIENWLPDTELRMSIQHLNRSNVFQTIN